MTWTRKARGRRDGRTAARRGHGHAAGWAIGGAVLAAMVLFAGCGEQDLYKPPKSPYVVSARLILPSETQDVDILGDYAYAAGGQAGLHVVDISDPKNPVLVRTLDTTKYAEAIRVASTPSADGVTDIAFVVEGTEGITTYNVSRPDSVYSFDQGSTAVDGNGLFLDMPTEPGEPYVAYLAENWKGVRIFESVPTDPGLLYYGGVFANTLGYAKAIAVRDGWGYVADDEMGVAVLDCRVRILYVVRVVSSCDTEGNALGIALGDGYAYVADGRNGLVVMAINEGDTPVPVGHLPLPGICRAIEIRNTTVFLAAQDGGVHIVDVSNPAAPELRGTVVTSYATGISVSRSGVVVVSDRYDGLIVLTGPGAFPDRTPPARVLDLRSSAVDSTTVALSWHAPGDDGLEGTAAGYDIRYSLDGLSEETWGDAVEVEGEPDPGVAGTAESMQVGNLEGGRLYYFGLRAVDQAGNWSSVSNVARGRTLGDTLAPAAVRDLAAGEPTLGSIALTWTAPGNDGNIGIAVRYDLRRSTAPITEGNWPSAVRIPGAPDPSPAGTPERYVVEGLEEGTTYYFALRSEDEIPNISALSNVASATTQTSDQTPPAAVTDLAVSSPTPASVTLTWTATGDDGQEGTARVYDLRYATFPIDGANWAQATEAAGEPDPLPSGGQHEIVLGGLAPETVYYFALKVGDEAPNWSPISNVVSATTGSMPGTFTMGSPAEEPGREDDEVQRGVTLTRRVLISDHEVTQAEYLLVMGSNPSRVRDLKRPVENVTWYDATAYCNALSARDGLTPAYILNGGQVTWVEGADGWRLPTEAEWERACRAGASTALANGPLNMLLCEFDANLDAIGWYCGNAGSSYQPIKGKAPNAWGYYDMHGNVWEWCWDWYGTPDPGPVTDPTGPATGDQKVIRGGSWYYFARDCRSASRGAYWPNSGDDTVGFRVCRTLP